MPAPTLFTGKPETGKQLLEALECQFTVKSELGQTRNAIFLDTFDWRLYRAGFILKYCHKTYLLQPLKEQAPTTCIVDGTRQPYRFFREFPEGELKLILAPIIDVRALLPILSSEETSQMLRLLNRDEKTLVKLELITLTTAAEASVLQVRTIPLRGYDKAARRVKDLFHGLEGLRPITSPFDIIQTIGNLQPGNYSNKLDVSLDPEQPAAEATRKILLRLLETMGVNKQGIVEDIDSEFLHDFRVSVRRTRAALGQIKQVFPATETNHFRNIFAELGRQTNLLRDLDVYLLQDDHFHQMLPLQLQPGLSAFFIKLKRKRRTAVSQIRQLLLSPTYREQMEEWESFLREPAKNTEAAANAKKPIRELASFFIYRRYRQIIKSGNRITPASPDSDLHQLRIDGKKLRYLLEFFASLYPKTKMRELISQLKKLQDNLGEFNDLSVQQDYLHQYLETLSHSKLREISTAAAIGGLLACLQDRHHQVRNAFANTFSRFNTSEIRTIFHHLFEPRRSN